MSTTSTVEPKIEDTVADTLSTGTQAPPVLAIPVNKPCACGNNCGKQAPEWGDVNEECFARIKQAKGMVKCPNFDKCHHWRYPKYQSCLTCNTQSSTDTQPEVKLTPQQRIAQQRQAALDQKAKAEDAMADAVEKHSDINLARAKKMFETGAGEFVAEKYRDAVVSFELVVKFVDEALQPYREVEQMHTDLETTVPALLKELQDLVDSVRTSDLFVHSGLEEDLIAANKWFAPEVMADILAKDGAPGFVRFRIAKVRAAKTDISRKVGNFSVFQTPSERAEPKAKRSERREKKQGRRSEQDAITASIAEHSFSDGN